MSKQWQPRTIYESRRESKHCGVESIKEDSVGSRASSRLKEADNSWTQIRFGTIKKCKQGDC